VPLALCALLAQASAAGLEKATVTRVHNTVRYGEIAGKKSRAVAIQDVLGADNYLLSEADSRAEMKYDDGSLVRIGPNTVFSFNPAGRVLSLDRGSLLFHIPKGAGGGTIKTPSLTASVTGTVGKVSPNSIGVLNGEVRLVPSGQVVRSGQIAVKNADGTFTVKPFSPAEAGADGLIAFGGPMPGMDQAFHIADRPGAPLLRNYPKLPPAVAAALRAEIAAKPANASAIVSTYLRKYPKSAIAVVVEAARALPLRNDLPDVPAVAALGRAAVEIIYAELPGQREDVKSIALALVEAVCVGGACPDPLFASQVLQGILPLILKNDPAMASVIIRQIQEWCPNCGVLLADLRSRLFSPLTQNGSTLPRIPPAIEPNAVLAPTEPQPPTPLPPATQFNVP
jgi:hypothetical protein